MAFIKWGFQGTEFANCSCDWGCPCQFNSLPTHGHCRAHSFFHIDHGVFGSVSLDGLRWGILASWPGPIHEGNGTLQIVVDERADPDQRAALESIARGENTEPGVLITQVFTAVISNVLPVMVRPIDLTINL